MTNVKSRSRGFTLLELLLVMVIMSSIMVMIITYGSQKTAQLRREKTALQINEVLNAALAFYLNNGRWPSGACGKNGIPGTPDAYGFCYPASTDMYLMQSELEDNSAYLPSTLTATPYPNANDGYSPGVNWYLQVRTDPTFFLKAPVAAATLAAAKTEANIIASMIPNGTIMTAGGNGVTVYAIGSVSIPGQNLGNARSVNFSSIYSSGACVPAPVCPTNMKPSILVAPTSVNGISDANNTTVSPVSSFVAFARGGNASNDPSASPYDCAVLNSATTKACSSVSSDPAGQLYWRVCLNVVTENGRVTPTSTTSGLNIGSILAMTRCVPNNGSESPAGTPINIWTSNVGNNP